MTKREFFEARAKADFERRVGVTHCPSLAEPSREITARYRHVRIGNSSKFRFDEYRRDAESGEAKTRTSLENVTEGPA